MLLGAPTVPLMGRAATEHATTALRHPVVGAWRWVNDPADPASDSYAIFHPDGTYVEASTFAGVAVGVWAASGERSADLTEVFQDIDPSLEGFTP